MLSTTLIVDEFARRGRVGLFWKKIAPRFMDQMAPARLLQTHSENSVSSLVENAVQGGAKKIILIGDQRSHFVGINSLMRLPQEIRNKMAIGFWPLRDWDMLVYSANPRGCLESVARIFKAGHTCPVDLGKVELIRDDQTPHVLYFWGQCDFSYVEDVGNPVASPLFLTRLVPFHIPVQGYLQTEYQSFHGSGGLNVRIGVHPNRLHSLQALPEDLKQTHKFLLLWQQGISYRGHWIRYPWSTLGIKHQGLAQTARKSCLIVKFQATNDPLSLRLDEQRHRCTNATFEIARNALPVITKMVPAALPETAQSVPSAIKLGGAMTNWKTSRKTDWFQ